ncbi:MAG TPA: aldose 1-epimerase [Solirubrobacteraceae bacterium]|jgi:galactose mutarotase-like enzyme
MALPRYRAEKTKVAELSACVLHDDVKDFHATWLVGAGMLGASLTHRDEELLWQGAGAGTYANERKFMGVPFLHPWANRLDRFGYQANGHEVELDPSSPLLLLDDNGLPIHGLLTASRAWSLQKLAADEESASMTAALAFDRSELLRAFPFQHRVEIEIHLDEGGMSVATTVTPTGEEAVPIAFGFHPYLRMPGLPRAEWTVSFPVRRRLLLDSKGIPTGATEPVEPIHGAIGDRTWDDGFDRIDTPARFEIHAGRRTTALEYTDGYPVAQIFAPPGQDYICVEPMTAPTNALNSPDGGFYSLPAGERFSATFRIVSLVES